MIGKHIRKYRKQKRITLKELGKRVGYAENSVWQWENDKREPNIQTLILLSKSLEISVLQLLGGIEMENGKFMFNGKEYSLREELEKYDKELPSWLIEEYVTYKMRIIAWCDDNKISYEHSSGRELLFIPIHNKEWGEEKSGFLLEVPEAFHYENVKNKAETIPTVYFSTGNTVDGYRMEEVMELSVKELEETIKKYNISPIKTDEM